MWVTMWLYMYTCCMEDNIRRLYSVKHFHLVNSLSLTGSMYNVWGPAGVQSFGWRTTYQCRYPSNTIIKSFVPRCLSKDKAGIVYNQLLWPKGTWCGIYLTKKGFIFPNKLRSYFRGSPVNFSKSRGRVYWELNFVNNLSFL